jgi:hypothetical protein
MSLFALDVELVQRLGEIGPGPGAGQEGRPPWAHENQGGSRVCALYSSPALSGPNFDAHDRNSRVQARVHNDRQV